MNMKKVNMIVEFMKNKNLQCVNWGGGSLLVEKVIQLLSFIV